jgi:hypothetical protein
MRQSSYQDPPTSCVDVRPRAVPYLGVLRLTPENLHRISEEEIGVIAVSAGDLLDHRSCFDAFDRVSVVPIFSFPLQLDTQS